MRVLKLIWGWLVGGLLCCDRITDDVTGKKWIYVESSTLYRQVVGYLRK